jgi:Alpha-L-fucosidase
MEYRDDRAEWWREAKYGMFIHWGLYSLPAGRWGEKEIPFGGEWIMKNARIPLEEYSRFAEKFNPALFDADEWVGAAKNAGMKYMVVTAKHHDGFAMYDSKCSDYNIVARTPFGKDPLRLLSDACKRENIVFCLYYSQLQDWHDPDAVGNDWDYPNAGEKDLGRYFENKVKPQIKELLTGYGPIGILWFDTPYEMPREYCEELVRYVRSLQPNCLVNSRIGYGLGDYLSMGDNSIPVLSCREDWEAPITLNQTWGYKSDDDEWKTPLQVLKMLVKVNGRGGNFLLNVGPDANGEIPAASMSVLKAVGDWMRLSGASIYRTRPAPNFPYELNWGGFTAGDDRLYMHIFKWPRLPCEILVYGLKTKVRRAYFLSGTKEELPVTQTYETGRDEYRLKVYLPEKPTDNPDTVVVLELGGKAEIYPDTIQADRPEGCAGAMRSVGGYYG